MSDRVLLTGVSGFLGGHIALQLLNAGYTVRGSLRNLDKADAVRATLSRAGANIDRLEFVALDLLDDTGWAAAMADCRYLQHTASPFILSVPRNPQDLIRPAVQGTRRALNAAMAANIERVVLTSSVAAIQYGHSRYDRLLSEADWTNVASPTTSAYAQSKTLAEQEAWRIVDVANRHNDLAVINPAAIFGPLLDADPGTSSLIIRRLIDGKLPAVPAIALSVVDVRDVAALHVAAMTDLDAGGQRCIASVGTYTMAELGKMLRPAFPERRIPTAQLPNWLVRLASMFDQDVRNNMHELGASKRLDGTRAPLRLGHPLIPANDAAIATAQSLIEHKLV